MERKAILRMILLFGVLFLLTTSMVGVNAQDDDDTETEEADDFEDEDDDGVDDETEEENEREVEVEVQDYEATIKSSKESNGVEESIEIGVHAESDGIQFSLEYEIENETSEKELEFEVTFYEIIEYIDDNDNGLYNESTDTLVQTYAIETFNPIVYTTQNTTNGMVHTLEVTTSDGIFAARVYATGEFADINGTTVAPNEIKIDVIIDAFDYHNDTSQLAMKVELEASAEKEYDDETEDEEEGRATEEEGVDFTNNEYSGFFTWKETATVDGVDMAVKSSLTEASEYEEELHLNYPRGDRIVHDPKIGVANIIESPSGMADLSAYLPIIAILGVAIVLGIVLKVRRG
jgi:hypothetical protein